MICEGTRTNTLGNERPQTRGGTGVENLWIKHMQDKISGADTCLYSEKRSFRGDDLKRLKSLESERLSKNLHGMSSLVGALNALVGSIRNGTK